MPDRVTVRRHGGRIAQLLVLVLVVEYLLVPQLAGTRRSLHLLFDVDNGWLLAALGAEFASLLTFTLATRVLLAPREKRPKLHRLLRIDLASIALSHAVPGGAAAGTALGYRLLTDAGVARESAAFAKVTQGVLSTLVLQLLLWSALMFAIPLHGGSPLYVTASAVGAAMVVGVAAIAVALVRHPATVAKGAGAVTARLPRLTADTGIRLATQAAADLHLLLRRPKRFAAIAFWSSANWLFDAAALWCAVRAFGHTLGYDGLLVPFCLANMAAWVPLTPSGLGVVEGLVVPLLVGFGTPHSIAILGVLVWRFVNFWLPIPLGAIAYAALPRTKREANAERESSRVG